MNLSWKESLLQFWFIFLASLFSFNFQFFFIKALSCYHYPSYPLKIMKENSYSGNMDISQEIKRNSFCNNILFSIRFQTSRPLGRNCRRTLLTQLTDRFYWWTLFPMESSPINIVSPVWVPDYYQVNSHQNKERHKITIQAWMVNRIKVRNNMAEKKIELQMKPKEKRITRQIELRIVNRRILVIVLIYLVSLVSSSFRR